MSRDENLYGSNDRISAFDIVAEYAELAGLRLEKRESRGTPGAYYVYNGEERTLCYSIRQAHNIVRNHLLGEIDEIHYLNAINIKEAASKLDDVRKMLKKMSA